LIDVMPDNIRTNRQKPASFRWRKPVRYWDKKLRAIRKDAHKAHFITSGACGEGEPRKEHHPPLLFNLADDPGERHDVGAKHPDVIADLVREAEAHRRKMVSGRPCSTSCCLVRKGNFAEPEKVARQSRAWNRCPTIAARISRDSHGSRRRARVLVFLLLSISARAQLQFPPVGIIDFYGLRTVNGQQVRDALHIAVGDSAIIILGRIGGLSEEEIQMAQERGDAARVIAAATRH
jgi:hypothetical protein